MALTDTAIKKAKPKDKQYKLYDERGLLMIVTPKGGKWWRFKYLFNGKEKLLSLGTYPDVSLKKARDRRDDARTQVAAGIDPGEHRKAEKAAKEAKQANSFEIVGREWFGKHAPTGRRNTLTGSSAAWSATFSPGWEASRLPTSRHQNF